MVFGVVVAVVAAIALGVHVGVDPRVDVVALGCCAYLVLWRSNLILIRLPTLVSIMLGGARSVVAQLN